MNLYVETYIHFLEALQKLLNALQSSSEVSKIIFIYWLDLVEP